MDLTQAHAVAKELAAERPRPGHRAIERSESFLQSERERSFERLAIDELFHEATTVTDRYERRRTATRRELATTGIAHLLQTRPPERDRSERVPLATPADESDRLAPEGLAEMFHDTTGPGGEITTPGATRAVETHVFTRRGPLAPSVYTYAPSDHELAHVDADPGETLDRALDGTDAAAVVCLSVPFARLRLQFGARGYRYALQAVGAVTRAMETAAADRDVTVEPVFEFRETPIETVVGASGADEAVLAVLEVSA